MDKPILCLDFDGVLHWYRRGWQGADNVYDEPVPGAMEFVMQAQEHFKIVISSSRCSEPGGIVAIQAWLKKWGFPPLWVTAGKPAAMVTLDDRALTFDGRWPDIELLKVFKPWNARARQ